MNTCVSACSRGHRPVYYQYAGVPAHLLIFTNMLKKRLNTVQHRFTPSIILYFQCSLLDILMHFLASDPNIKLCSFIPLAIRKKLNLFFCFLKSCHRSTLSDQQSDCCIPLPHPGLLPPHCTSDQQPENRGHKTLTDLKRSGVTVQHLNQSQQYPARFTSAWDRNCHSPSTATQRLPP